MGPSRMFHLVRRRPQLRVIGDARGPVQELEMREGSRERSCLGDRVPRPFIKLNDEFAPKSLLENKKGIGSWSSGQNQPISVPNPIKN